MTLAIKATMAVITVSYLVVKSEYFMVFLGSSVVGLLFVLVT